MCSETYDKQRINSDSLAALLQLDRPIKSAAVTKVDFDSPSFRRFKISDSLYSEEPAAPARSRLVWTECLVKAGRASTASITQNKDFGLIDVPVH